MLHDYCYNGYVAEHRGKAKQNPLSLICNFLWETNEKAWQNQVISYEIDSAETRGLWEPKDSWRMEKIKDWGTLNRLLHVFRGEMM